NVTRSDNNPQGFLIESFTIIENRDIGQYER
ncbi:conjugative transposon protein TraK, partial [Bacteroides ovatus]